MSATTNGVLFPPEIYALLVDAMEQVLVALTARIGNANMAFAGGLYVSHEFPDDVKGML